jgi:hypothetical protein
MEVIKEEGRSHSALGTIIVVVSAAIWLYGLVRNASFGFTQLMYFFAVSLISVLVYFLIFGGSRKLM